jgi:hypothetical protein
VIFDVIPWHVPTAFPCFIDRYAGYTRGTTIKQADAILLGFPLQFPFSPPNGSRHNASEVFANDLEYYATVTDAGTCLLLFLLLKGCVGGGALSAVSSDPRR